MVRIVKICVYSEVEMRIVNRMNLHFPLTTKSSPIETKKTHHATNKGIVHTRYVFDKLV